MVRKEYSSISIPKKLFSKMEEHIKETGFKSVSDFATFVFREILIGKEEFDREELEEVKKRLKQLGYL